MYTIGADPGQALCLIGANIIHDYKYTYGPRDTNLTNLIYFYADCYLSCDFASIMPVSCDSSREHYVLNRDFYKARSPSNTYIPYKHDTSKVRYHTTNHTHPQNCMMPPSLTIICV